MDLGIKIFTTVFLAWVSAASLSSEPFRWKPRCTTSQIEVAVGETTANQHFLRYKKMAQKLFQKNNVGFEIVSVCFREDHYQKDYGILVL